MQFFLLTMYKEVTYVELEERINLWLKNWQCFQQLSTVHSDTINAQDSHQSHQLLLSEQNNKWNDGVDSFVIKEG